jgi:hypothetical protein
VKAQSELWKLYGQVLYTVVFIVLQFTYYCQDKRSSLTEIHNCIQQVAQFVPDEVVKKKKNERKKRKEKGSAVIIKKKIHYTGSLSGII